MNLTESRLSNIIRESINNLLLREYHNQLRIPFSEFGNGHSFIDEFIDWIQYSSEKGVLPKPTISWEKGLRKGYHEYAEKDNDEWDDYGSFREHIKTYEDNGFFEFDKNGNLYVERSITMSVPNGDIDSEDSTLYQNQIKKYEKNVGGCWAVGHGNSEAYCGYEDDTTIVLKGYMFLDDIYWEEFVRLWSRGFDEYEVRTYPNGRVMLTEIQVGNKTLGIESFDGPRILKSTFFGNNVTFNGNFAKLGYERSEYDKAYIDRQGNEYTSEEYNKTIKDELKKYSLSELYDKFGDYIRIEEVGEKSLSKISVFGKFYNFVKKGSLLLDEWLDGCNNFYEGLAKIELNGKWNFINQNGELLWKKPNNEWFDTCGDFHGGFATIRLNSKCNFINQNGEIVFPDKSFTFCERFRDGFARVRMKVANGNVNERWNFIAQNGNILYKPNEPDQWFEYCGRFNEGFAVIQLNGKFNLIKQNGEFLWEKPIEQWFDYCYYFHDGASTVQLNKNWYYLDRNGNVTKEKPQPQVSESLVRNAIRESIMSYIKLDRMK